MQSWQKWSFPLGLFCSYAQWLIRQASPGANAEAR